MKLLLKIIATEHIEESEIDYVMDCSNEENPTREDAIRFIISERLLEASLDIEDFEIIPTQSK
jgi:hypothetical protein